MLYIITVNLGRKKSLLNKNCFRFRLKIFKITSLIKVMSPASRPFHIKHYITESTLYELVFTACIIRLPA